MNCEAINDVRKSFNTRTRGLRTVISEKWSARKSPDRTAFHKNSKKTLISPISTALTTLNLDSITESLQDVLVDVGSLVGLSLPSLSNSVNNLFTSITSSCHLLISKVNGIVDSLDGVIGSVSSAVKHLIDTLATKSPTSVRKLSYTIDDDLDNIFKTFAALVDAVGKLITTITTSNVGSALQAVLKTTIVVVFNSLTTIQMDLNNNQQFVTPLLSATNKILSEEITAPADMTAEIDIDKIVRELRKCSAGTVVDVECVSSAIDGSSSGVDIVVTAISSSPPYDGQWDVPLEELKSSTERSLDEISYICDCITKALPGWRALTSAAIMSTSNAIQKLIDSALLTSNGDSDTLETSIVNIAEAIQMMLHSLDAITSDKERSQLESDALKSIERAYYDIISIVYSVFYAVLPAIDGYVSASSILAALTAILEVAVEGSPSSLLDILAAINYICVK